jgi:hypothetical protein
LAEKELGWHFRNALFMMDTSAVRRGAVKIREKRRDGT